MDWLKYLNPGKKERKQAYLAALETARKKEVAVEVENLEKDIPSLSLVPVKEPETSSDLEILLQEVEKTNPGIRQPFIDALIAQHYGVKRKDEKSQELVPYKRFSPQITALTDQLSSLPECIGIYTEKNNYGAISYLKKLARAGILNEEEAYVHLAAAEKLHLLLNKRSLISPEKYFYNLFSSQLCSYEKEKVGLKYSSVLAKHFQERGQDLDLHLNVALDYTQRLQDQLADPQSINKACLGNLSEISFLISQAKTYLSTSLGLFQEIKNKLDL